MNFFDIQSYIVIKLLLLIFIALASYLVYKKIKPVYFLALVGVISAAAYAVLVNNLELPLWGLQGDEITIAAMYNTFAHTSLMSDFSYHSLAPFYPPLWFWLFAVIGRVLNYNGVLIAKLASGFFFLLFPIGLYYFQKYLSQAEPLENKSASNMLAVLAPLLILTILDKDLLIGKPYEVVTAALSIFWYIHLYLTISRQQLNNKKILLYGLIAGLIAMTYYLWLVFAALALLLLGLIEVKEARLKYFWSLIKTMLVALLVSAPFILPLIINYFKFGIESWQTSFFTPSGLNLWLPMFQLTSLNSLILLFGLVVLVYYRQQPMIKQLAYLFLSAFVWWGLMMLVLLISQQPFQEFRGFYILAPSILAIAAAYGLTRLWNYFKVNDHKNLAFTLAIIGVIFFASQSIFGFFVDDPIVRGRRIESKAANQAIVNLVNYLKTEANTNSKLTLQTTPQILAFTPINNLIYFNQHNNHPAAIFSERYKYLGSLANSSTATDLYERIKNCPYGQLERLIFYSDKDNYYLYFHLNKIIDGLEVREIIINKDLFSAEYFKKVYDSNGYVVINVL